MRKISPREKMSSHCKKSHNICSTICYNARFPPGCTSSQCCNILKYPTFRSQPLGVRSWIELTSALIGTDTKILDDEYCKILEISQEYSCDLLVDSKVPDVGDSKVLEIKDSKILNVGDSQGSSCDLSADANILAIGGPGAENNIGAAWIFNRSGNTWIQHTQLIGSGAIGFSNQGVSCSISGDGNVLAIGGPSDNGGTGATWIFDPKICGVNKLNW